MNLIKRIYCRCYQNLLKLVKPVLPYHDPIVLDNNEELGPFLKWIGIKNVLLLTDENIRKVGLPNKIIENLNYWNIKVHVFQG